ncbi:MAG TPA: PfkB family carbohydrate kinase [Pseudonocardia sp.]|nr:PfkB family carbohydrate kinase [Pseudonocardia sp.]
MAEPARVYSTGSILVDLAIDVPSLPERGGDVLASGTRTLVGGGFNLAAAVARQQVPCCYGAPHGTGRYGDLVRAALASEGIETAGMQRPDGDTGFCLALIEPDGERTFVTMPGVEAQLRADELAAVPVTPGDLVAVSGYDLLYPGSGAVLAQWVGDLDGSARVALDPGPLVCDIPTERLAGVLGAVSVLTLNQREARLLGAAPDACGPVLLAALRAGLRDRMGLRPSALLVVREGPAGCLAIGGELGDRVVGVPAPRVRAVDTTGAGDTHTGVLLAELARGRAVEAALGTANRAAAISVTRVGSATSPRRAELT